MTKKIFIFFSFLFCSCSEKVDLIVYNADIYTVNDENSKASSFAVKDGKFIFVGDDSVTSKYSSSNIINAEVFRFFQDLLIHMLIFTTWDF